MSNRVCVKCLLNTLYTVVLIAIGYCSSAQPCRAENALVGMPARIVIQNYPFDYRRIASFRHINRFLIGNFSSKGAKESWESWRGGSACPLFGGDTFSFGDSGIRWPPSGHDRADQDSIAYFYVEGWGLPIVGIANIPSNLFTTLNQRRFGSNPNIRSLLFYEPLPVVINNGAREKCLPTSEEGSSNHHPGSYFRPEQLSFVVGICCSVGGLVLVFKVLDKVYLSTEWCVNTAVTLFFMGAALIWLGLGCLWRSFHLF